MLPDLTPDQRAKLARGWVWRPGHAFVQPHPKTGVCDYSNFARVSCVVDGEPMAMRGVGIGNPHPVLTDDVTADGLLRTARAMWRDESMYVVKSPPDGWTLCRIARGCVESWTGKQWDLRLFHEYEVYPTESATLLAAILAAPEAA